MVFFWTQCTYHELNTVLSKWVSFLTAYRHNIRLYSAIHFACSGKKYKTNIVNNIIQYKRMIKKGLSAVVF